MGMVTTEQIRAIGWMRWRVLMNSLRATREWLDYLAKGMVGLFLIGFAIGPGFAIGAAGFLAAREGSYGFLVAALWGIFTAWQLLPLIVMITSGGFQYKQLLRFPLHFRTFFVLTAAYGLMDPAAIIGVIWLVFLVAGATIGSPVLLPWAVLLAAAFGLMNLLLSVMVGSWLERILAKRRTREIAFLVFILTMMSFQFIGPIATRWERRERENRDAAKQELQELKEKAERWGRVAMMLPPGMAWKAIKGAGQRDWGGALAGLAGVGAYGAVFGCVLAVRLRAQFRGEELSEAVAQTKGEMRKPKSEIRHGRRDQQATPRRIAGGGWGESIVGAVMWKDILYLRRIPMMLLQLIIPLIMVGFFSLWSGKSEGHATNFVKFQEFTFPAIAAYALLVQSAMVMNVFGMEGKGIQFYLMAPVRFREILAGKNLTVGLLAAIQTLLALVVVSAVFGPPGMWVTLGTVAWLGMALMGNFSVGNVLSLYYPRQVDMSKFKNRQSGIVVMVSMVGQIVMLGIGAAGFFAGKLTGSMWIAPLVFAAVGAVLWVVYRTVMARVDGMAMRQREVLCGELCKNL